VTTSCVSLRGLFHIGDGVGAPNWTPRMRSAASAPRRALCLASLLTVSLLGAPLQAFATPMFHMINEADPDASFEEVRIRSFDTLADLKALNQSFTSVLGNNIGGSAISVAGLAFDGSQFHMITEGDPDASFEEVRIRSFDSLADLKALNQSSTSVLGPNIGGSAISVRALVFQADDEFTVSEPATFAVFAAGLVGIGFARRRQRLPA